jgi:hypothetical protein
MAIRTFDEETYARIGRPDIGHKMFYINKRTNKRVYGNVTELQYLHKNRVRLKIKPFKKNV